MAPPHVLVIDDDRNSLEVLALLLELAEVAYTLLQDPRQLEAALDSLPRLDLVFLDLEMPNLDGYQVFEFFQSQRQFQGLPIVAYTVHLNEIQTAKAMGFHSFLAKPLDSDLFPEQLASLLRGQAVWKAS
jgi:two-component system, cell cycle response regulator DivK